MPKKIPDVTIPTPSPLFMAKQNLERATELMEQIRKLGIEVTTAIDSARDDTYLVSLAIAGRILPDPSRERGVEALRKILVMFGATAGKPLELANQLYGLGVRATR